MKYIKEIAIGLVMLTSSCTKYLDTVPNSSLTVPQNLADFQQLLDNEIINTVNAAMGEFGTDDIYLPETQLASQELAFRNGYVWAKDIDEGAASPSWNNEYRRIYYANIVLNGLVEIKGTEAGSADYNFLKGWALFLRAFALYDLEELYGAPYRPGSAAVDLGVPLKLGTNLEDMITRATVAVTFQQIISDLEQAAVLLPTSFNRTNRNRPSRSAAFALLARVHLVMQNYQQALKCSENVLENSNTLLDYNTANSVLALPFRPLIDEVLYNAAQINYSNRYWQVEKSLYDSYSDNDLRKLLFFKEDLTSGGQVFKGYYSTSAVAFNGLAVDEVYLMKAECEARLGKEDTALQTLNALLVNRFKADTYVPYSISNTADVLSLILTERRKQCLFRNLRWSDLRRLNQEERFAKTLTRTVNRIIYQLPPNDPRYVMPIPADQIRATGIEQNIR